MKLKPDTNQTRKVGMATRRSDFDRMVVNPFTQMESNPSKLERCVKKVAAKGGVRSPWAVCQAALKKGK